MRTIDLETTMRGGDKDFPSDPFDDNNFIVACGYKDHNSLFVTTNYASSRAERVDLRSMDSEMLNTDQILVGQNFKFDLLYLMIHNYDAFRKWYVNNGLIWDTMFAEYLLSGQMLKFTSLDQLVAIYGGKLKDYKVKEFWGAGLDTTDIDKDVLQDYLHWDIKNTERIAQLQMKSAAEKGMLQFIFAQMNSLVATTIIEYNGMAFSTTKAAAYKAEVQRDMEALEKKLIQAMKDLTNTNAISEINWNPGSTSQWVSILFGGKVKYRKTVEIIDPHTGQPLRYKTGAKKGEIKMVSTTKELDLLGIKRCRDFIVDKGIKKSSTTEGVIKELIAYLGASTPGHILHDLLAWRGLKKDVTTYYEGYSEKCRIWGCIHPRYNHVSTATGRLSCVSPNLQNVTKKEED